MNTTRGSLIDFLVATTYRIIDYFLVIVKFTFLLTILYDSVRLVFY